MSGSTAHLRCKQSETKALMPCPETGVLIAVALAWQVLLPAEQACFPSSPSHSSVCPASLRFAAVASSQRRSHCLQEPVKLFDASEFCGTAHPYGWHAFADNAAADAFVLTSLDWSDSSAAHRRVGAPLMQAGWQAQPSSHSCRLASADGCSHQCFSRLLGQHSVPRLVRRLQTCLPCSASLPVLSSVYMPL